MKTLFLLIYLLKVTSIMGQNYIDSLYSVQTTRNIEYGISTDFAKNDRSLTLDITEPTNDVIPECGRPLLIAVHGGAFLNGSKEDLNTKTWMTEFAHKGYTAASVNYRLGMFQTQNKIHCNVTNIYNVPWDCANQADTSEWYRAAYRAMQDIKGAIRYLINNSSKYHINPNNVYLVGESAGGFVVLQTAFLDSLIEKPESTFDINPVLKPDSIYESYCIRKYNLDTSISKMNLERPDLGSIEGALNPSDVFYKIRGVASFYGAIIGELFKISKPDPPFLFLFHQPNDMIVPFKNGKALSGFSEFFSTNFSCPKIVNTPQVNGSMGIINIIDSLHRLNYLVPKYETDFTNNNSDYWAQIVNESVAGHSLPQAKIHNQKMAIAFSKTLVDCNGIVNVTDNQYHELVNIYPNPIKDQLNISFSEHEFITHISIKNLTNQIIQNHNINELKTNYKIETNIVGGFYWLEIETNKLKIRRKIIIE